MKKHTQKQREYMYHCFTKNSKRTSL